MRRAIFIIITLLCIGVKVHAQIDPTLAGMVLIYTEKSKKTLKNQEKIMLLQTTGHIWTKEEVEAVTDLQREFNDYLDSFRSVISYAAQIYGFYHEITHLTENMGEFTGQKPSQCRSSSTLHEPEQDIPGTDIQLRGNCQ